MIGDYLRQMSASSAADLSFDPLAPLDDQERQLRHISRAVEQAERDERARQAAIVKAALAGPAGQAFLAWLESKTIKAPMPEAQLAARTAEEYALIGARRDGAAQIYHTIIEALAYSETTTEDQS